MIFSIITEVFQLLESSSKRIVINKYSSAHFPSGRQTIKDHSIRQRKVRLNNQYSKRINFFQEKNEAYKHI